MKPADISATRCSVTGNRSGAQSLKYSRNQKFSHSTLFGPLLVALTQLVDIENVVQACQLK